MIKRITITYTFDFDDEEEAENERERLEDLLPDMLGTQDIDIDFLSFGIECQGVDLHAIA